MRVDMYTNGWSRKFWNKPLHMWSVDFQYGQLIFNKGQDTLCGKDRLFNNCCCLVTKSCLTLRPHCSPPGSSVHGISQASILEWVAISSSSQSSQPTDRPCISCIGRQILYHWATREALLTISIGKTISIYKGIKLGLYLTSYTKINSKWIKDLNVRAKTLQLLEENIKEMFHDVGFGSDFLDMTPKPRHQQKR